MQELDVQHAVRYGDGIALHGTDLVPVSRRQVEAGNLLRSALDVDAKCALARCGGAGKTVAHVQANFVDAVRHRDRPQHFGRVGRVPAFVGEKLHKLGVADIRRNRCMPAAERNVMCRDIAGIDRVAGARRVAGRRIGLPVRTAVAGNDGAAARIDANDRHGVFVDRHRKRLLDEIRISIRGANSDFSGCGFGRERQRQDIAADTGTDGRVRVVLYRVNKIPGAIVVVKEVIEVNVLGRVIDCSFQIGQRRSYKWRTAGSEQIIPARREFLVVVWIQGVVGGAGGADEANGQRHRYLLDGVQHRALGRHSSDRDRISTVDPVLADDRADRWIDQQAENDVGSGALRAIPDSDRCVVDFRCCVIDFFAEREAGLRQDEFDVVILETGAYENAL